MRLGEDGGGPLQASPFRNIACTSSKMTDKLRIGYVPEHFSLPILQLAKSEWGQKNLEIVSQPSGTGQMLTSFDANSPENRKIDVAVALTEALIAGIAKGRNDYELVGTYVTSSLKWCVFRGNNRESNYLSIHITHVTSSGR